MQNNYGTLCVCSQRLIKVFITHEPNKMRKSNFHQLTSLTESHKSAEVHGCRSWVSNFSIISHTLGILTTNITYCIVLLEYINESQVSTPVQYRFKLYVYPVYTVVHVVGKQAIVVGVLDSRGFSTTCRSVTNVSAEQFWPLPCQARHSAFEECAIFRLEVCTLCSID